VLNHFTVPVGIVVFLQILAVVRLIDGCPEKPGALNFSLTKGVVRKSQNTSPGGAGREKVARMTGERGGKCSFMV